MSVFTNSEEQVIVEEFHEESDLLGSFCRVSTDGEPVAAGANMEAEKRIRREIANSNERRRMQSINAGFQSLRTLLPHHEGEKLSKAAILQQTAEYIYSLEQEKTRLLSQNCQLKRLVNQHEGGDVPPKKRKAEQQQQQPPPPPQNGLIVATPAPQPVSAESSDDGVGSVSPEPVAIMTVSVSAAQELIEVKAQLDRERRLRMLLEDQLRSLENQVVYSPQLYQVTAAAEDGTVVSLVHETAMPEEMQVVGMDVVPPVAQTQTVVSCSPPVSRSPSPQRLPSVLEAAIKAEPKVEVERIPSPVNSDDATTPQARLYVANTSRQNLETIVEAIRHLEGDHLFGDEPTGKRLAPAPPPAQDVPLALTTKPVEKKQRLLQVEMNPFLQFHASSIQQQQQSRPGVIVVKQHS